MSSNKDHKDPTPYMKQTIQNLHQHAHQHQHATEHTGLLRAKEQLLGYSEIHLQNESKIFWLQIFAMFIFIYASACSKQHTGVDLAFFVGIMMAIPICAKQTGAHLNPAVSYSMNIKDQYSSTYSLLWLYFKAQVAGAIISQYMALILNNVHRSPLYPQTHTSNQIFRMILSQIIGVFILIFFVLYATGPFTWIKNDGAKYVYISIFVYIGRRFACVSGNQINLALTISQAFVGIPLCNYLGFKYLFIWLIGDALGVIIAVQLYKNIVQPTLGYMQGHRRAKEELLKVQSLSTQMKNINKV